MLGKAGAQLVPRLASETGMLYPMVIAWPQIC